MTQVARVKVSQWLMTAVAALMGIWGGYQVLQYKVMANSRNITEIESNADKEGTKIWNRIEIDRIDRQDTKDDVRDIKHGLGTIVTEQIEIKEDVKSILEKINNGS